MNANYFDHRSGKHYRVIGTTVTQYAGKPFFSGSVLHMWGKKQSETDFATHANLGSWLEMMGFQH